MRIRISTGVLGLILASSVAVAAPATGRQIVTAESVQALGIDVSSVHSKVPAAPMAGLLTALGPLGYTLAGVIGPFSPAGGVGPMSNLVPSPSILAKMMPGYEEASRKMTFFGGSLSDDGPLGSHGPLTRYDDLANSAVFGIHASWTNQLQAGGLLAGIGPFGPLSPLGVFGPVGVLGEHCGYKVNANGEYVNAAGKVQRKCQGYELAEDYDPIFAKAKKNNDTSFSTTGFVAFGGASERFSVTSAFDQILTVVSAPQTGGQITSVSIYSGRNLLASSNASIYVNWIQMQVKRGERLTIEIKNTFGIFGVLSPYRLYVVGSGPKFTQFEVSGDHVLVRDWR